MHNDQGAVLSPLPINYSAEASFDRTIRKGLWLAAGVVFGLGGLAATLPVTGAVVASGEVSVESHVKRIAHPTGGVVSDILVRDGDHVRAGQTLMRLDGTISGANATMSHEGLNQLLAREARLTAERDSAATISFPAALTARANDPVVSRVLTEEQRVFTLRAEARHGQVAQLEQRIRESEAEIAGYQVQIESTDSQYGFAQQEVSAARELWKKRFTTLQHLSAVERTAVALKGTEGALRTQVAQSRAKITEIRQQMIALAQDARSQAGTELNDVQGKLSELRQRQVAADDVNGRNIIRSPQDGIVDKLVYTTIGGVVQAGTTIMEIVPISDRLIVRAKIRPTDIDQVAQGQAASLRFSAFNMRTTPQIKGTVSRVSAELMTDEKGANGYYVAEITIPAPELRRLGELKLRPGMPVEAFVKTGDRTMLSYIVKPLGDQLQRAFHEN